MTLGVKSIQRATSNMARVSASIKNLHVEPRFLPEGFQIGDIVTMELANGPVFEIDPAKLKPTKKLQRFVFQAAQGEPA